MKTEQIIKLAQSVGREGAYGVYDFSDDEIVKFAALHREALIASGELVPRERVEVDKRDAERICVVVQDNLPYLENLILLSGHESAIIQQHPSPCRGKDFCLIKQAKKGADAIRAAIDRARSQP